MKKVIFTGIMIILFKTFVFFKKIGLHTTIIVVIWEGVMAYLNLGSSKQGGVSENINVSSETNKR